MRPSILRRAAAGLLVLLLNHGAAEAEAAGPNAGLAIWRVKDGARPLGTAFLIDQRGYLLTAAHVVGPRPRVAVVAADDKTMSAVVVLNLCAELKEGLCEKGQDAALLRIEGNLPAGDYPRLDIDLHARRPSELMSAVAWGWPDGSAPASVPMPVEGSFVLEASPTVPRRWRTQVNILPGMSGGPVVRTADGNGAFGILSWRTATTPAGPASAAFATPTDVLRGSLVDKVPASPDVEELTRRIVSEGLSGAVLRHRLDSLGVLDLIHVVRGLPRETGGRPRVAIALAQVLRDKVYEAGLDEELLLLAAVLAARGNLTAFRDQGTAQLWASWRTGQADPGKALDLAGRAAASFEAFFDRLTAERPAWAERRVVAATSADLGSAYALASQDGKAAEWFAVSHLAGRGAAATQYLAEHLGQQERYAPSLSLYCQAYNSGRRTPATTKGFWDVLQQSQRAGGVQVSQAWETDIATACAQHGKTDAGAEIRALLSPETRRILDMVDAREP